MSVTHTNGNGKHNGTARPITGLIYDSTGAEVRLRRNMPAREEDPLLAMIAALTRDPSVQIEKMEKLLEMRERIQQQEAEKAFTEAMNRVQEKVPPIYKTRKIYEKNGGGVRSMYANLEDVDKLLRPLTLAEGFMLSYTTDPTSTDKLVKLQLVVKHYRGHKETYDLALPVEDSKLRSDVQDVAAAVSFGRRILMCLAFNIVTLETDINGEQPSELLTEEQVEVIRGLLEKCNLPEHDGKFLAWAGADQLHHIRKTAFERIVVGLTNRAAKP
ncbi:MAG TPA: ERF family protein [Bryobacteraceae bacterium]|nr:ERF family protein [Bryobacteraceae bacterium]